MLPKKHALAVFAVLAILATGSAGAEPPAQPGSWTLQPYGQSAPVLHCMPLAACVVALENGETIQSRFLSDSARWQVEPGTTGPGQGIPVLAVKPHECGITTTLQVTTDRRVYSFILTSPACADPGQLSPSSIQFDQLRFTYPEEFAKLWQPASAPAAPGIATSASNLGGLHFDYQWDAGRHALEPRIVFDDGHKTYIVLKEDDRTKDFPAVFVHGQGGTLEAVNFEAPTTGGLTYTVDRLASELVLVSGPASNQKTIIHRKGR
jgi:P-type conjugative transfer protein TrbG